MKIAIAASEAAPFCKTGGLGDVMQALPEALSKQTGNTVCLFLPYYGKVKYNSNYECEFITNFTVNLVWRRCHVGLFRLKSRKKKLQIYFIDNEQYFNREQNYGHMDDGERFAFFSKAVLSCMSYLDFKPDILQCNDWQTALIPVLMRSEFATVFPKTKTVFTIHNIEYQGWADLNFNADVLGLGWEWIDTLRYGDAINFMKAAIMTADAVSTVSETYAKELQYPYYSHGMSDVLRLRALDFYGITNGIDTTVFDPNGSPNVKFHYTAATMCKGKAANKKALQEELGLEQKPNTPLYAIVSRLAGHKGIDLLTYVCKTFMERDAQLAVIGTGDAQYEHALTDLAEQYPGKMCVRLAFDPALADRVYAGADAYLMPSKSEPCGLSQLIAMHYGTVPVVHATGGLNDTVKPYDSETGEGKGFTFLSYNGEDFMAAIDRSLELYHKHREAWNKLAAKDMAIDVSWKVPAQAYLEMFQKVIQGRPEAETSAETETEA